VQGGAAIQRGLVTGPAGRWSGRVAPAAAAVLAGLVLALTVALVLVWAAAGQASVGNVWVPVGLGLGFAAVGVTVARRQPANPVGWLLAVGAPLVLVTSVTSGYALLCYRLGHGGLPLGRAAVVAEAMSGPVPLICLPLAVLLFPGGQLSSRRWRWVVGVFVVIAAVILASQLARALGAVIGHPVRVDSGGGLLALDHPPRAGWERAASYLAEAAEPLVWLVAVGRQATAWRRAGGERRQQLKWLVSGACLAGSGLVAISIVDSLPAAATSAAVQAIEDVLGILVAALPVAIGVAILKYRLYEIDRIISRTLAYAVVTGLLIGVYAGLVLLAQQVLQFSSPVAVAASTLAAAALFNPLRRRVQRAVDRRFNRARYDAERTVAAFAGRLQDAVDLDSVRDDLASAVQETLEPAHISVWVSEHR
jgi:hypothetical protein